MSHFCSLLSKYLFFKIPPLHLFPIKKLRRDSVESNLDSKPQFAAPKL